MLEGPKVKINIEGIAFWNSWFVGFKKNQHENKNIGLNEPNKTTRDVLSWHVNYEFVDVGHNWILTTFLAPTQSNICN
jgi:hypothetical protein